MTRPQDIFGAAPKSVLNKPFMHVQDQKPIDTYSGSSVVGDNKRDLNTVLTNEIAGASLTNNEITLPAGKYYIECESGTAGTNQSGRICIEDNYGILLSGISGQNSAGNNMWPSVRGEVTLTATRNLFVNHKLTYALADDGLGYRGGVSPHEVYTDLRIWKLDSQIRTPIANNGGLYPVPANTYVTGNMFGFDYKKTGDHAIQVQPGVCFDATNNPNNLLTGALQTVTIPSAINEVYNLFICNDNIVRPDTDVDGVNLSGTYQVRWIGFAPTDASGVLLNCVCTNEYFRFTGTAVLLGSFNNTSYTLFDVSSFAPIGRIVSASFISAGTMLLSYDGVNKTSGSTDESESSQFILNSGGVYIKGLSNNDANISSFMLRR